MKPTAVVFSTAVAGMAVFWMMLERSMDRGQGRQDGLAAGLREALGEKSLWGKKQGYDRSFLFLALSIGALAGIWGRTLYLVGVPVTSVFYQVFQKLGFTVKYPFYAAGFPAAGSKGTMGSQLAFVAARVLHILTNPQGDDMAHVIIAWGGVLPLALLIVLLFLRAKEEKRKIYKRR